MTYARQRLWLGITGVGSTVLLCTAAVTFDLPHRLIHPLADSSFSTALASIALAWMLHALLLLPVDVAGGLFVVRERRGVLTWIASWLRGVVVQWLMFALAAALLLRTGQQFGVTYAMLVFLLLQLVLLSRQGMIAWMTGGITLQDPTPELEEAARVAGIAPASLRIADGADPAFIGGWMGTSAQQFWLPARWVDELSAAQLAVVLTRRAAVRALGLRRRGLLVALAWNTAGFVLATSAPRADLVTAAGFVTMMCWFTLWSFIGVLVLPSLSRPAVFTADAVARRTHDASVIGTTITQLDGWQDDEPERGERVETVFHPVPSRGARMRALDAREANMPIEAAGAWQATRLMLYLSWAGLGGLSRAVHCNVGRPPLWVMLPGD
jgi:hypothetical protein